MRVFVFSDAFSQGYLFLSCSELIFFAEQFHAEVQFGQFKFLIWHHTSYFAQADKTNLLSSGCSLMNKAFHQIDCTWLCKPWKYIIVFCQLFTFRCFIDLLWNSFSRSVCLTGYKYPLKCRWCFYSSQFSCLTPHSLHLYLIIPNLLEIGNCNCPVTQIWVC